jgi:hypothetical protein
MPDVKTDPIAAHGSADPSEKPVTIRLGRTPDDDALRRLAQLDERPAPTGPHVIAEIEGAIVAAVPLGPGEALGDPFRPTAALMTLLEVRAAQLSGRRRLPFQRTARRRSRAAATARVVTQRV